MRAVYGKAERGEGMAAYWWGAGVVVAAGLVLGVVMWRGGMPLWRDYDDHRLDVAGLVFSVACMSIAWPVLVPFALHALWRWLWKNAGPPGGDDPGR